MMRFASLGSGSKGNALLIESGNTLILLDCGFGPTEVSARMARLGLTGDDLDAIIVTHEYGDPRRSRGGTDDTANHGGGGGRFSPRHDIPVYLTRGTFSGLGAGVGPLASRK